MVNFTRYVFLVVFFLLSEFVCAQPGNPVLSAKHIEKIQNVENPFTKLKIYKRFYRRDSIRQEKQMVRYWKAQGDSMSNAMESRQKALADRAIGFKDGINSKIFNTIYKPWATKQASEYLRRIDNGSFTMSASSRQILHNYLVIYFLEASQNDTVLYALKEHIPNLPLPKQLSTKINNYKAIHASELRDHTMGKLNGLKGAGQLKSCQGQALQYTGDLKKYSQYAEVISNPDTLKGFVKTEGVKLAKEYASKIDGSAQFNSIKGQLGEAEKLKGLPGDYKAKMDQLQDTAYIKDQAKQKAEALAMQYVSDHPEVIQGVQRKMSLLMKKYSVVPNSNDLSTAVKRTSLKGRTFFEHLQVAANFQVISLEPVSIDFSPQVGYKINSRLVIGAGGLYRKTFSDSLPTISPDVLGYKGYINYEVLGNFFVTGEYGRNSPGLVFVEGESRRKWENTLLAGIGRKFLIHPKLEMTLMAGYNFLHSNEDTIFPRPWVIRFGFQSSELAFLNKKRLLGSSFR